MLQVNIDIPDEVASALRAEWGDLDEAAKQALLIESYRTGRISVGFLAESLGLTRWEAEQWLGARGVTWNYGSDDLDADRRTLDELFGDDG